MFRRFISVVLLSVCLGLVCAAQSPIGFFTKGRPSVSKKELQRINIELSSRVDSLKAALDSAVFERDSLISSLQAALDSDSDALDFGSYVPGRSDSLLSIMYIQQRLNMADSVSVPDPEEFASDMTDEQYIERLKAINSFIPLPYNETVRSYIVRYSEKAPRMMSDVLSLCYYYMPIFEEAFSRHGVPQELKVLSIVESKLNPKARSRAGALGLWQFMYASAKSCGLRINSYFDDRMDPYRSADAAARYLRTLYEMFGDWCLAISAYNCGPGGVRKAMARSGGKTSYWDIYPYLPRETRNYVPAFVGMLYALYYRNELGLEPAPFSMPVHVDTLHIHKKLHFKQIEEMVGVPADEIRMINPQYINDIIPGDATVCELRLPYNYTDQFIAAGDSLYRYKASEYLSDAVIKNISSGTSGLGNQIVYKVKSGDTLGGIAHRYHTTVSNLKKWNGLRSDKLRIGQRIYIYNR